MRRVGNERNPSPKFETSLVTTWKKKKNRTCQKAFSPSKGLHHPKGSQTFFFSRSTPLPSWKSRKTEEETEEENWGIIISSPKMNQNEKEKEKNEKKMNVIFFFFFFRFLSFSSSHPPPSFLLSFQFPRIIGKGEQQGKPTKKPSFFFFSSQCRTPIVSWFFHLVLSLFFFPSWSFFLALLLLIRLGSPLLF